jgi:hypothetical protein
MLEVYLQKGCNKMMKNLKVIQEIRNRTERPFGVKGISPDVIDDMIDREERRIMKRRVLCNGCFEYKSTSGSCSC